MFQHEVHSHSLSTEHKMSTSKSSSPNHRVNRVNLISLPSLIKEFALIIDFLMKIIIYTRLKRFFIEQANNEIIRK